MDIFNRRPSISRPEFKNILRKNTGVVPGAKGLRYNRLEKEKIERELFLGQNPKKEVTKNDYKMAVRGLKMSRYRVKDPNARAQIDNKVKYLKKMGGLP